MDREANPMWDVMTDILDRIHKPPDDLPPIPEHHHRGCECGMGCESFLECRFWYYMRRTKSREQDAERQVPIGRYRVDCLCTIGEEAVVIELDGKRYHDPEKDAARDRVLLEVVDSIVRIPYAAMVYYPRGTFSILSQWWPRFQLVAKHGWCIHIGDLKGEMKKSVGPDKEFATEEEWYDWADPIFEVWGVEGNTGFSCSPLAWKRQWRISPIKRYQRDAAK